MLPATGFLYELMHPCMFLCLVAWLLICLFICLFVCVFIWLFIWLCLSRAMSDSGGGVGTCPRDAVGTGPCPPLPLHLPGFANRELPEIVNRGGRAATDRVVSGQPLDDPVDARPTGEPIAAELLGDPPLCPGSQWGQRPNIHRIV